MEMTKKYELTGESKSLADGIELYQIRALQDFGNVRKGELGGWIQREDNLSHEGNCWVSGDAIVRDTAMVYDNAKVSGNAVVRDTASVGGNAKVYGDAEVNRSSNVTENATVRGNARVSNGDIRGNALIDDYAVVTGPCAEVFDDAVVSGRAKVEEFTQVGGHAVVAGTAVVEPHEKVFDRILSGNEPEQIERKNDVRQAEPQPTAAEPTPTPKPKHGPRL